MKVGELLDKLNTLMEEGKIERDDDLVVMTREHDELSVAEVKKRNDLKYTASLRAVHLKRLALYTYK